ncbi:putative peptidoglycan binding domain containing protein [Neofusicoccum parvum UCRNP2]|uniref:Putative peptidoglycan binding domain containing protein n=1 Tax=Botryosphaeria parva (strain UCR-NP2) TaxID=1287680 RepID=R1E7V8_BOTPV|nr:putative peptidoglycan binding domain containing protein [Neofusicoccum parvum UCRNP2]
MADRDREYYRDYSRGPARGGRDGSDHRYYDDEYVVVERPRSTAGGGSVSGSRPRAVSMYSQPQPQPNHDHIEVEYEHETTVRRDPYPPPPPGSVRGSVRGGGPPDVVVNVPPAPAPPPPPPPPPGGFRDEREYRERERVIEVDVDRRPPGRAKSVSTMTNPPASVHPSQAPPARREESVTIYEDLALAGTWLNSDNGMANGELAVPSNVTRLSRAIKPISKDGIPQIVYYQFGVGSRGNVINKVINGSTGGGLEENVREAYSFLSNNYSPGDEIYLVGFSRGAFTARSIAGLIGEIGILTKKGLGAFVAIFEDVQHRRDRNYRDRNPDIPFSNKPNPSDPAYRHELEARGLTTLGVKIKAIGVWDTVGSLGAPRIGWLTRVGLQPMQSKEMTFYDTKLSNCIEHAFQALGLDERRAAFSPAVWEKPRDNRTILRQVWFPGVHSNVGGGYDDQQLANITLSWMVSQLQPFLDFKIKYIFDQEDENDRFYERHHEPLRPWSFGEIPNSSAGIYSLGGSAQRTPGQYTAVDPQTGKSTGRPLRDTHEYMHASVRARFRLGGPGEQDKGKYDPEPLDDWRLVVEYPEDGASPDGGPPRGRPAGPPDVFWKLRGNVDERDVSTRVLPEAPLSRLEREIAERDPETYEYLLFPPRTRQRGRRARSKSRGPRESREVRESRELGGDVVREEVVRERRRIMPPPPGVEYRRSMPERIG